MFLIQIESVHLTENRFEYLWSFSVFDTYSSAFSKIRWNKVFEKGYKRQSKRHFFSSFFQITTKPLYNVLKIHLIIISSQSV